MCTFLEFSYRSGMEGDYKSDTMEKVTDLEALLKLQVSRNINTIMSLERRSTLQSEFRIKFEFPYAKNDVLEVYYISPYSVCVTCFLNIYSHSGKTLHNTEKTEHYLQGKKWHYLATIHKKTLNYSKESSIIVKFKYQIAPKNVKYEQSDNTNTPNVQLANDLEKLLKNDIFSDVTMKSIEGTEFKLHKNILATRSAVLKANFEHNTTECHTNVIESPLEANVLQEVLTFIYSDRAPRVDEIPEKLLAAADYYQLEGLKILCEEPLYKKLTIENVIETLELADLHSAGTLKQKILKFIKDSCITKIVQTEGWSNIKSVELVKCICEYIAADNFKN